MSVEIFFYVIIFFLSSLLTRAIINSKIRTRRLPPSPTALPIIGHLHLLNRTPYETFHDLATKYGPLIHLRLGSVPCVIASSSQFAKELLLTNELSFTSRPVTTATHGLTYNSSGLAFSPYGPFTKFIKKTIVSQFLDSRNLARLQPIRNDELQHLLNLLINKSNKCETVNLSEEVSKLSNNVVSRMMLSIRFSGDDEQGKEVRSLVREVTGIFGEFNVSDFIGILKNFDLQGIGKRCKNIHKRYDAFLERIMKEREEVRNLNKEKSSGARGKDFLDMLLDIAEGDQNPSITLSRENIKAYMLDFLTAGTDTSGIVIEWALSELLNHPTKLETSREEIYSVVGKNRLIKESDIPNLPYLISIFKETLRLHPPIPILDRKSTQDCKIGEYEIPADTTLFVNVRSIGRDPNKWEQPQEFRPERFMPRDTNSNQSNTIDVRGQHFDLLPFGSGRRGCPGMSLVVQFIPTVLGLLIQCFDWNLAHNGEKLVDNLIDMTERPGFTVPKAHPLTLVPSTHLDPFPAE